MMSLTLYTLTSVCTFSILFSVHFLMCLCAGKENLFNNQEVLQLTIISFILMTSMFDSGVILKGEIRCWSLLGVKGLITAHILNAPCIC